MSRMTARALAAGPASFGILVVLGAAATAYAASSPRLSPWALQLYKWPVRAAPATAWRRPPRPADHRRQRLPMAPPRRTPSLDGPSGRYLHERAVAVSLRPRARQPRALRASALDRRLVAGEYPLRLERRGQQRRRLRRQRRLVPQDFRLPSSSRGYGWIVRFESVNYAARVWIDAGTVQGGARASFLLVPFSNANLDQGGVDRLVTTSTATTDAYAAAVHRGLQGPACRGRLVERRRPAA